MTTTTKFVQMFVAIGLFALVFALILGLASRFSGRKGERTQGWFFIAPTIVFIVVGLLWPAIITINQSFRGREGDGNYGLANYTTIFTEPELLTVLRNTALWVILVPLFATAIGLLYAIIVDRSPFEKFAKALVFLPMAISLVGASIIWRFMYEYRPPSRPQIGLFNEILVLLGQDTYQFLLNAPWNTIFLIFVMVWIQAGFAMTILSAAIKAIPDDIIEAAKLDGVGGFKMFRFVTLPSIRPSVVVVLTTIGIATLKVFDIVRTMTGGQFDTSIVALEFYNQSFRYNSQGIGSALAVILFVLVVPIIAYNIVQMRKDA